MPLPLRCGLCGWAVSPGEAGAHVRAVHVGSAAAPPDAWLCGRCGHRAGDFDEIAAHCLATGHPATTVAFQASELPERLLGALRKAQGAVSVPGPSPLASAQPPALRLDPTRREHSRGPLEQRPRTTLEDSNHTVISLDNSPDRGRKVLPQPPPSQPRTLGVPQRRLPQSQPIHVQTGQKPITVPPVVEVEPDASQLIDLGTGDGTLGLEDTLANATAASASPSPVPLASSPDVASASETTRELQGTSDYFHFKPVGEGDDDEDETEEDTKEGLKDQPLAPPPAKKSKKKKSGGSGVKPPPPASRYSEEQTEALKAAYKWEYRFIREKECRELSARVGVEPRRIVNWFQKERSQLAEKEAIKSGGFNPHNVFFLKEAFRVSPSLDPQRCQRIAATAQISAAAVEAFFRQRATKPPGYPSALLPSLAQAQEPAPDPLPTASATPTEAPTASQPEDAPAKADTAQQDHQSPQSPVKA